MADLGLPAEALHANIVYVLRSQTDSSLFYVGYTNNIERRVKQHNGVLAGGGKYYLGKSSMDDCVCGLLH